MREERWSAEPAPIDQVRDGQQRVIAQQPLGGNEAIGVKKRAASRPEPITHSFSRT